jgi:hypothetical protein
MKCTIAVTLLFPLLLHGCKTKTTISCQQVMGQYELTFQEKITELKLNENGSFIFRRREAFESSATAYGNWSIENDILTLNSKKYTRADSAILSLTSGRKIAFDNVQFKIKLNSLHQINGKWRFYKNRPATSASTEAMLVGNLYH